MTRMGYELIACYIFSFFIEGIVLWQYASRLFEPKRQMGERLSVLCLCYIVLFVGAMFQSKLLNAVLYFLVNGIFLSLQYQLGWHMILFHTVILEALMGACEVIPYHIIEYFAPSFFIKSEDLHHLILYAVLSKVIFLTIAHMIVRFYKRQKEYKEQRDAMGLLLIFIPMASLVTVVTLSVIESVSQFSSALNGMVSLSAVFLLAANIIVFKINQHDQKKNAELARMRLLLQKESYSAEHYQAMLQRNEEQAIFVHDIKNHLIAIAALNGQQEENNNAANGQQAEKNAVNGRQEDKVDAYIQKLLQPQGLYTVSHLCQHELLNAILCHWQQQCMGKGIAFDARVQSQAADFLDDYDMAALFGNLLDNAYEAAVKAPEPYIEVDVSIKADTVYRMVRVVNSCLEDPFLKYGDSLPTSKPDKQLHGLGLLSVRRVVEKYQGHMKLYFDTGTRTFHALVLLKWQPGTSNTKQNGKGFRKPLK